LVPVPSSSVIGTLFEDDNVSVATLSESGGGQDTAKTTTDDESADVGRYGIAGGTGSKGVLTEESKLALELLVLVYAIVAQAFLFLDGILCAESDGVKAELLDGETSEDGLGHGIEETDGMHEALLSTTSG
jgi:hypothetical protein